MAFGEVFTGLQQKTVDAQENSASLVYSMKFNEVQKYYSLTGHVQGILAYIINEKFFTGLPADLQKIVADGARKYLVERQRQLEVDDTATFLKKLAAGGMIINEITPANHQKFVDALKPMYANFAKANGQDILDLIAKYNK
jgi:TRAP-type C4-dicarboxylate transport system substrate-binding protein